MSRAERESPWNQYGPDKSYQAFCRTLPSAVSGQTQNIVYAHYRTAKNSGIGMKPPYSGIPLTYVEHLEQHQIGQYNFLVKPVWEELVIKYLKMWAKIE